MPYFLTANLLSYIPSLRNSLILGNFKVLSSTISPVPLSLSRHLPQARNYTTATNNSYAPLCSVRASGFIPRCIIHHFFRTSASFSAPGNGQAVRAYIRGTRALNGRFFR